MQFGPVRGSNFPLLHIFFAWSAMAGWSAFGEAAAADPTEGVRTSVIDSKGSAFPEAVPVSRGPLGCEPPMVAAEGGRYISVMASGAAPVAYIVRAPSVPGFCKYLRADGRLGADPVFQSPGAWAGTYAGDAEIIPGTTYTITSDCGGTYSTEASVTTWAWGDVNNSLLVDVDDLLCVLDGFSGIFANCTERGVDLVVFPPDDLVLDVDDILAVLDAFVGVPYLGPGPLPGSPAPVAPVVDIHAPITNGASMTISGTSTGGSSIEVLGPTNTTIVSAAGGTFSAEVALTANRANDIYFTAISPCGGRSSPAATIVIQDQQVPNLFIDFPPADAELTLAATDVAGRVGDMLSGFAGLTVSVNGQPCVVDVGIGNNGTFVCQNVPLGLGANVLSATATDSVGNATMKQINVSRIDIPAGSPRMEMVSGNGQTAPIFNTLPQPIVVRVLNGKGMPFVNKVVTFDVTRSDGRLTGDVSANCTGQGSMMLQCHTDANGEVRAFWRLGSEGGCGNNRIEVKSTSIAGTTFFCASATPGPARQINIGENNNQRGAVNSPALLPLRARVSDGCNGSENIPVTFTVTSGGGMVVDLVSGQAAPELTALTSTTGNAGVRYLAGPEPGNHAIEADFPGNPGSSAVFTYYAFAQDDNQPTTFRGLILDNASQPIGGAACMLVVNEQFLTPVFTNVNGQFEFTDIPFEGPADLYINGLVATTVGGVAVLPGSYPTLHFEDFAVVPNAVNSLPAPVLLPKLNPANARNYSTTQETILTVAGIEGLRMVIAPGSMKMPNGSPAPNGTVVALNQVHHDDVPMPMPDGAAPQFAWTLQPGGATFDPPVRVEYPNMSGLPAGSIAYFLTFNHDTGRFEIFSTGTVNDEGSTIVTDPGSGLSLAGWGCNCPPYSVTGKLCNCTGLDLWAIAREGSQLAIDIIAAIVGISDCLDCANNAVSLIGQIVDTYNELRGKGATTCQQFSTVLSLANSAKSATLTCIDCFAQVPDPAEIANRALAISNAIGSAITVAQQFNCLPGVGQIALNVAALVNNKVAEFLELATALDAKGVAAAIMCGTLQTIVDSLAFCTETDGNLTSTSAMAAGGITGQLDSLMETLQADIATYQEPDKVIMTVIFNEAEALEMQGDFDVVSDELEAPELAGFNVVVNAQGAIASEVGTIIVSNVAAPDLFGPGGPGTVPDFLSDDFLRVTGTANINGVTYYAFTDPFQISQGQTFVVDDVTVTPIPPPLPAAIAIGAPQGTVLEPSQTSQLVVTATLGDGTTQDVTPRASWTVYRTSCPLVATVGPDGVVTAHATGTVFITAVNDAATAVRRIDVATATFSTTILGFVVLEDGTPIEGAQVSTPPFGGSVVTGPDGAFVIAGLVLPAQVSNVTVRASADIGQQTFQGRAENVPVIPAGLTDAGIITLHPINQGPLFPGPEFPVGSGPYSVALGDLNGDNDLDLAVANLASNNVSILLNNGSGRFISNVTYPAGDGPRSVTIGDLDGDNDLDLAVANIDSNNVSILLNNGAGTFATQVTYPVGSGPSGSGPFSVAIGDLDGDNDLDVAAPNYGSNNVSILLNNGAGTFATQITYPAGSGPFSVTLGDLDGDNDLDLAVANVGSNNVSILLNNAKGTFASQVTYPTGSGPFSVALGDLDGDNDLDLAAANFGSNNVSILLNNGAGTLAAQVTYPAESGPFSIALGDLDADDDLDLAVPNTTSDNVSILLNNGNGTFANQVPYAAGDGPRSVTIGDLDGDNDLDLAAANINGNNVSELLNNGNGTFASQVTYTVGSQPETVTSADLDGDGDLDLAVANRSSNNVSMLFNSGDGTFATHVTYGVGLNPLSVTAADLDSDGDLDLAVANIGSENVSVLLNSSNGSFATHVKYGVGSSPYSVTSADLDGDGDLDLAVANLSSNNVSVLFNNGNGTFATHLTYGVGSSPYSISSADLDGDGDFDLAVANRSSNNVSVLRNNGDGTFAIQETYGVGFGPESVTSADLDGDGDLDLAAANYPNNNVSVLRNKGDGTFAMHVTYGVGSSPSWVSSADLDGDGYLDLAVSNRNSNNVSVLRNNGDGTFAIHETFGVGLSPESVTPADLDGDGDLDLAVANQNSDNVSVLLNRRIP